MRRNRIGRIFTTSALVLALSGAVGLGGCGEPTYTNKKDVEKTQEGWLEFAAEAAANEDYNLAIARVQFAEEVREGTQCGAELAEYQKLYDEQNAEPEVYNVELKKRFLEGTVEGNYVLVMPGPSEARAGLNGTAQELYAILQNQAYDSIDFSGDVDRAMAASIRDPLIRANRQWESRDPPYSFGSDEAIRVPKSLVDQIE